MPEFVDYYTVLQVNHLAEQEVIKAAYKQLAKKYHPDGTEPNLEKMKEINKAYEILSDPDKRRQYDKEWIEKQGEDNKPEPPKPVIDPPSVQFDQIEVGESQKASFIIRNLGGSHYNEIYFWIGNSDSWLKIVEYASLTKGDELPLKIDLEATGDEWGKTYSGSLNVRLDAEEAQATILLRTRSIDGPPPEPLSQNVRYHIEKRKAKYYLVIQKSLNENKRIDIPPIQLRVKKNELPEHARDGTIVQSWQEGISIGMNSHEIRLELDTSGISKGRHYGKLFVLDGSPEGNTFLLVHPDKSDVKIG